MRLIESKRFFEPGAVQAKTDPLARRTDLRSGTGSGPGGFPSGGIG